MNFHRPRRALAGSPSAPGIPSREWIASVYGEPAETLVNRLAAHMRAAGAEAAMPSTPISVDVPARPQHQRELLWRDLEDLRSLLVASEVGDDDVIRDQRLRAAVAGAVGAASRLALASTSQPTAAYLGLTLAAVDEVLRAAGRHTVL